MLNTKAMDLTEGRLTFRVIKYRIIEINKFILIYLFINGISYLIIFIKLKVHRYMVINSVFKI